MSLDLPPQPPSSLPPPTGSPMSRHLPPPPPAPGSVPARPDRGNRTRLVVLLAVVIGLGMLGGWSTLVVIAALVVMIFMHELGHYVMARRAGMKVSEFFLGFGPRIWSFRRGEVEYGFKAVPAGAYVRILGMSNLEEVDPVDEPRTYRQKSMWRRLSVAVAGSAMHFLMALVMLLILLVGWGMPSEGNWRVSQVSPNSPAARAGLVATDRIVAINGQEVATFNDLTTIVRSKPGEAVVLSVVRDGAEIQVDTVLAARNPQGQDVGFLGIGREYPRERESIPGAVVGSATTFGDMAWQSVAGLGQIFSPSGVSRYVDNLTGTQSAPSGGGSGGQSTSQSSDEGRLVSPIGAVQIGSSAVRDGLPSLLTFLIAVNIFVGIFNLVPLLPFDGGHVVIALYEGVRSRKGKRYYADVSKLMPLTYAVVLLLGLLFIGNIYLDLVRPVGG